MKAHPTMDDRQIALWANNMRRPQDVPTQKTVAGKPMVINNHRSGANRAPKPPEKPATDCVHHWRISEPNGPTCEGQCRKCGATRTYVTAPDDVNTSLTVRTDKVGRW